jgi:hypothetical protein
MRDGPALIADDILFEFAKLLRATPFAAQQNLFMGLMTHVRFAETSRHNSAELKMEHVGRSGRHGLCQSR